jgi:ribosomal protein L37E
MSTLTTQCDRCGTHHSIQSPNCPNCGAKAMPEHEQIKQATAIITKAVRDDGPVHPLVHAAMQEHANAVHAAAQRVARRGVGTASQSARHDASHAVGKGVGFMDKMNSEAGFLERRTWGASR